MSERTHDEFCFNTDLYQDDVEGYMCICNRLDSARHQERTDQRELTKAEVAEAEKRGMRKAWDSVRVLHGVQEHLCGSEAECYTIDAALGRIERLFKPEPSFIDYDPSKD